MQKTEIQGKITAKYDLKFLFKLFVVWRLILSVLLVLASKLVTLQENFLGGGLKNYIDNPQLWSWLNFDGEHYLSIARTGYRPLTYFYFPLYPKLVGFVSNIFGGSFVVYALSGLLISHVLFFAGLVGLWKLMRLDLSKKNAKLVIFSLLVFPTAFYFVSYYTESLFLALSVWSFYFARKKNWTAAFLLSGLATATRVVGLALFLAIMVEYIAESRIIREKLYLKRGNMVKILLFSTIGLSGILIYMVYLNKVAGDPFEFVKSVGIFGDQRSSKLIILPQVFYRYIFKVLPNVNYNYFPTVFTTLLEFVVGAVFLVLSAYSFFKLRLSYSIFLALGYIIPTLSGSFSSLPRYVIILFPAFILIANILSSKSKMIRFLYLSVSGVLLAVSLSLFVRGYWLS